MPSDEVPPSSKGFAERLRAAQERRRGAARDGGGRSMATPSGLGIAFRIGVELVAALIVGVGIGWLLDRWLGTGPWLLILFFVLGSGAGILNVFRTVERLPRRSDGAEER